MKTLLLLLTLSTLLITSGCSTTAASSQSNTKLTIIKAVYGVKNNTVDVTEAVASIVDGNQINLAPSWVLGTVDPANGVIKNVTIAYRYAGQVQIATFAQNETVRIPLIR